MAENAVTSSIADEPVTSGKLFPMLYHELRRLAAAKLARESPGQTLQPTALVHEVWLRLGGEAGKSWANRVEFFATAATAMRHILVDNARRKQAQRRGGNLCKVSFDATGFDMADIDDDESLLVLNDALDGLVAHDPRKAELVKYRYFVGLSMAEAADLLGISIRTADRDWAYARAWLLKEVKRLQT